MQEIRITDIKNVKIGNAQNMEAATGCTVILCENEAAAGLSIRGGGPASRETGLLDSKAAAEKIHGVLLSGGSAFGLDAAGGVLRYLEEKGIGYDVGVIRVPLVCQSCLFDLTVGSSKIWPDAAMAYEACENAQKGNYRDGCLGAGTGATVGKMFGMDTCMKSGIGSYAVSIGELQVGAVVAVNALGDVYDWRTEEKIAGLLSEDKMSFRSTEEEMYKSFEVVKNKFVGNTTIGAIITNASFQKYQLNKLAEMAQNGYARSIRPVHTSADGDSIYALSVGDVAADMDMVGTLSSQVMAEAIRRAVTNATSMYGYKSAAEYSGKQ